ncbi:hypothetical protein THIX_90410 [Thiomonas sp. X19]|nr:hypothetical protein THIX_90410 [Thiomonas sp. X19]
MKRLDTVDTRWLHLLGTVSTRLQDSHESLSSLTWSGATTAQQLLVVPPRIQWWPAAVHTPMSGGASQAP